MTKIISHFFGRQGGVSTGIYNALNCGYGSNDADENIRRNRAYVASQLKIAPDNLITLHQMHSADVVTVTKPWQEEWPRADAMVTNRPNIALGILTADCAPVLFYDETNNVIGAAHAGWRGAFGGILENTIAAMEKLGAVRDAIQFKIGPCIHQKSYEVSAEFQQNFLDTNSVWEKFFMPSARANHYQFDLPGFVAFRLSEAGIINATPVRSDDFDTCRNETAYFSYRRMTLHGEPDYGRQISVIALKDDGQD